MNKNLSDIYKISIVSDEGSLQENSFLVLKFNDAMQNLS